MKSTHTLRTGLFLVTLAFTGDLISAAPKKVSPPPAKASLSPANVSPESAKISPPTVNRTIKVQVIALDQPWMWNRLGAAQPGGMIYALARDVVKSADNKPLDDLETLNKQAGLAPLCGHVRLRDDKRARPLVLRANKGDCLEITFVNLLSDQPVAKQRKPNIPAPTRWAGLNATGLELAGSIESDASWVGTNPSGPSQKGGSLAKNGELKVYKWYAVEEGTFLIYSAADTETGYQANQGLFGAIHVEPEGAEWYRSQITHDDLVQATLTTADMEFSQEIVDLKVPGPSKPDPSNPDPTNKDAAQPDSSQKTGAPLRLPPGFRAKSMENRNADKVSSLPVFVNDEAKDDKGNPADPRIFSATGQPLINYYAVYKAGNPRGRTGPVLQMLQAKPLGKPLYDQPLKKDNPDAYGDDLKAIEAGIIPADLRQVFKDGIKVELSAGARVTDQQRHKQRYTWLITDQGRAFYMEAIPPVRSVGGTPSNPGGLKISNAELELIYSDLTAVITGPNAGTFPLSNTSPTFRANPSSPDRRQPYREYTIIYHQAIFAAQAFAAFYNANLHDTLLAGSDNFAINYGSGAIGPEVIANRLGIGPMGNKDAVDLKFEEFFLSAWAVGDPAMVVDLPANASKAKEDSNAMVSSPDEHSALRTQVPKGSVYAQIIAPSPRPEQLTPPETDEYAPLPKPPVKATKAFFPEDPSNVYHSYMNDHVKFRILHAGAGPSHVHHLHAHQWLRSPNSDNSSYLDSQLIVPGSAFTLEIAYNGSGNRNKTVGDSIFHCHFYPHFAQGMWAMWRVHDVFEEGTMLNADGRPKNGINRALPDGEIELGTPIPAIVPLPTIGMAPMPAQVKLTDLSPWKPAGEGQGRRVEVIPDTGPDGKKIYNNPGFPFFVPGVSGHRPPHPPLDFAWLENPETRMPILDEKTKEKILLDGGLPRHLVLDGKVLKEFHTRWDFTKDTALRDKNGKIVSGAGDLTAFALPEVGTPVELAAMREHAIRTHPTVQPNGEPANFILNGLPPTNGAPYADPAVNSLGNANVHRRRYQAAVFQLDTILNKKGWHYPQQRMISLWQDVKPTVDNTRAPEPFFFRTNTSDTIQFWHTNLLPGYYELDDFQVRTPTDIVGQHIHLVKFDVTASDGAGNGFNYEDGTFAPDEVQERIDSINGKGPPPKGGLFAFDPATGFMNPDPALRTTLTLKKVAAYYPPPDSKFAGFDANGVPTWTNNPTALSVFGPPPSPHADAWDGAQTTIQLWEVDSLLNNEGVDRTLRTVFSHDHFGPSTHQQAGLYAGMIVEPENSAWYLSRGERMNTRADGGPTSWHGYVVTENPKDSYREFVLEFQDMQLAYGKGSRKEPSAERFNPAPDPQKASSTFAISQAHSLQALQPSPSPGLINASITKFYVDQLNKAQLPAGGQPAPPNQLTVPAFKDLFVEFGIPLSDKATVVVNTKDVEWTITEAPDQVNANAKYVVRAGKDSNLLVYTPDIHPSWSDAAWVLNAPNDKNNGNNGPYPQIVSQNQFGTYSLNYRNEPVPLRVRMPDTSPSPSPSPNPDQTDLALAYSSIQRLDADLNIQPDGKTPGYPKIPLVPNAQGTDPYTPLLEAYVNDHVQIRTLVGAHTQAHAFQIDGVKWRFEPDNLNSGWRNAQLMGLSEHFEMIFDLPGTSAPHKDLKDLPPFADYFYSSSSDIVGLNNGLWGIMRAYGTTLPVDRKDPRWLEPLPNNPVPAGTGETDLFQQGYTDAKNAGRPTQAFDVTAVTASVLPGGKLVFNPSGSFYSNAGVLYVRTTDLEVKNGKTVLKKGVTIEPLILRAAAGEWIKVTLHNGFALNDPGLRKVPPVPTDPALTTVQTLPYGSPFGAFPPGLSLSSLPEVKMWPSTYVGLHPQLVGYDPIKANGLLVGFNPKDEPAGALVAPGKQADFYWYAGELKRAANGTMQAIPIEFGATNLTSADPLLQPQFGMVGALIIEPEGATWSEDLTPQTHEKTYASATVKVPGGYNFKEFVVIDQDMVANSAKVSGGGAVNYRSEPFPLRGAAGTLPQLPPQGYSQAFSNSMNAANADPITPVFTAVAGTPVRFRLLIPSTVTSNAIIAPPVLMIHAHPWQEEPYTADSTKIGFNPLSQWQGAVQGGVGQKFDLVLPSAGGQNKIPGDYLYNTYQTANTTGTWGLFRVTASAVAIEKAALQDGFAQASGVVKAAADGASLPKQIRASLATDAAGVVDLITTPVAADGRWSFKVASGFSAPARLQVTAIEENGRDGASATVTINEPSSAEKLVTQSGQGASSSSP